MYVVSCSRLQQPDDTLAHLPTLCFVLLCTTSILRCSFFSLPSVILAVGPALIGPLINDDYYGAAFSYGAAGDGHFSPDVMATLIVLLIFLVLFTPSVVLVTQLDVLAQLKFRPPRVFRSCWLIFLFVMSAFGALLGIFVPVFVQGWSLFFLSPSLFLFIVCFCLFVASDITAIMHLPIKSFEDIEHIHAPIKEEGEEMKETSAQHEAAEGRGDAHAETGREQEEGKKDAEVPEGKKSEGNVAEKKMVEGGACVVDAGVVPVSCVQANRPWWQ